MCYVSGDLEVDRKLANETTCLEKEYKFPDGTCIKIGRERFEAPELLFNPHFDGNSSGGAHNLVFDVI
jgi:actin-related protein 2